MRCIVLFCVVVVVIRRFVMGVKVFMFVIVDDFWVLLCEGGCVMYDCVCEFSFVVVDSVCFVLEEY